MFIVPNFIGAGEWCVRQTVALRSCYNGVCSPAPAHPGEWSDDDFDVLADNVGVGRIMSAAAVPVGCHGCGRSPSDSVRTARRRTATWRRATAAMAAFAKSWRRE